MRPMEAFYFSWGYSLDASTVEQPSVTSDWDSDLSEGRLESDNSNILEMVTFCLYKVLH